VGSDRAAAVHLMAGHRCGRRFLVVSTAAFSLSSIAWLAFAISIGTLILSTGLAYSYRALTATRATGLLTAAVSGWTIVASLVFSRPTVQNLALASTLRLPVSQSSASRRTRSPRSGRSSTRPRPRSTSRACAPPRSDRAGKAERDARYGGVPFRVWDRGDPYGASRRSWRAWIGEHGVGPGFT
jgi:hypothetical protein